LIYFGNLSIKQPLFDISAETTLEIASLALSSNSADIIVGLKDSGTSRFGMAALNITAMLESENPATDRSYVRWEWLEQDASGTDILFHFWVAGDLLMAHTGGSTLLLMDVPTGAVLTYNVTTDIVLTEAKVPPRSGDTRPLPLPDGQHAIWLRCTSFISHLLLTAWDKGASLMVGFSEISRLHSLQGELLDSSVHVLRPLCCIWSPTRSLLQRLPHSVSRW
jgi:hypothetical protein